MITEKECKEIAEKLKAKKRGEEIEPITETQKKAVIERLQYEKNNMGFFNGFVSPKQAKLLEKIRTHRQVVVWGGVRSTKTNLLIRAAILLGSGYWVKKYKEYFTNDGQRILKPLYEKMKKPLIHLPADIAICCLDRQIQRRPGGVEETLKALLPTAWIEKERRVADYCEYILLKNGTKFWFVSAESGAEKMQSAVFHLVVFDESQEEKVYNELTSRVGRQPPKILMGFFTNKGRNWAYEKLIKPAERGEAPPYLAVERISMLDNPFIPKETKEEMITQWKISGEYERRVWGGWDDLTGAVFKNFERSKNVINASEIEGFVGGAPPPDWAIISGLDCHHTEKGAACGWIAIDPKTGRMYFFKEYLSKEEPAKWFEDLNKIDEKYPSKICAADPAIDATDNRHFNLWQEFRRHCSLPLVKANRDHHQGIQAIIQAFAPLRDADQAVFDGKPALYICDHCVNAIEQIESYQYKNGGVGDVVKKNDEFCDIIRYMLMLRPQEVFADLPSRDSEGKLIVKKEKKGGFVAQPIGGAFMFKFGKDPSQKKKGAFIYSAGRPQWNNESEKEKH